jgi:hypothetical protein
MVDHFPTLRFLVDKRPHFMEHSCELWPLLNNIKVVRRDVVVPLENELTECPCLTSAVHVAESDSFYAILIYFLALEFA